MWAGGQRRGGDGPRPGFVAGRVDVGVAAQVTPDDDEVQLLVVLDVVARQGFAVGVVDDELQRRLLAGPDDRRVQLEVVAAVTGGEPVGFGGAAPVWSPPWVGGADGSGPNAAPAAAPHAERAGEDQAVGAEAGGR